jgi:diketogulonate reductase-like aldo/keto reductase
MNVVPCFVSIVFFLLSVLVASNEEFPTTTLGEKQDFPLVGIGVGNLQHELIKSQILTGIGEETMKYRLIDTAHASHNEDLVLSGIQQALSHQQDWNIHVITKIWYTHLGYERTRISVQESLEQLKSPNIRVHILLHWPRCRDDIPWMNCEQEENDLPNFVKDAGPPPHLDKDHAFKESWKALEDIFLGDINLSDDDNLPSIESIGVSNFEMQDLKDLLKDAIVVPHIMQGNVWSYIFDPHLIELCDQHGIHFQAYNVMNGINGRDDVAPNAYHSLILMAEEVSKNAEAVFTPAQVILKFLVQNKVSIIPRTTQHGHLQENSPVALASIPTLTGSQSEKVRAAVAALLTGQDLEHPKVTFINTKDSNIHLFWKGPDGIEFPVRNDLLPGEKYVAATYPDHVFVLYDSSKSQRAEYRVGVYYGDSEDFRIEL